MSEDGIIRVIGARQNNLKNVHVDIPLNKLIVVTGVSGSGKTSLAFDTLYAEGQRRYAETFSPYTRQFLERLDKPQVDSISGIPPAVAIGQANNVKTSRSTVGTMTEIADHLKLLFSSMATLTCPHCQRLVKPWNADEITRDLLNHHANGSCMTFFEVPFPLRTSWEKVSEFLIHQGFSRIVIGEKAHRLDENSAPSGYDKLVRDDTFLIRVAHDRIEIKSENKRRLTESLEACLNFGKGVLGIGIQGKEPLFYSNKWHCPYDHTDFETPSPAMFAFNSPVGACPICKGFGRTIEIDYQLALPDQNLSIEEGVVKPWQTPSFEECQRDLVRACKREDVALDIPYAKLSKKDKDFILYGEVSKYQSLEEVWKKGAWYGIKGFFDWLETKTYKMHVRILLSRYRAYRQCPTCGGSRFQPKVHNWRIAGKTLPEINQLPISELAPLFDTIRAKDESEKIILDQVRSRIGYLLKVGLSYITLDRTTRTLSGGEFQRVNLTSCLGTSLVGTLFVLDEPSIGLHPRDTKLLIDILQSLRNQPNTIIVVEHDENVMLAADHILELGPLQGANGGTITFEGSPKQLLQKNSTITGQYLSHKKQIPRSENRPINAKTPRISFKDASKHNIHHLDFDFPLSRFVVITGVSGSGKSTLVHDIIQKGLLNAQNRPVDEPPVIGSISGHKQIDEVILVDQSPLSVTPRSTPVLYLEAYDYVRELFGTTELAAQSGLSSSSFSFNSGNGRCERCQGTGYEKISMQFLSDLYIPCPICEGKRFQSHVLKIKYHDKSIDDVLKLTVHEALEFFKPEGKTGRHHTLHSHIHSALSLLEEVGLGYIALGQPLNQMSGGEAQRLKLVSHLAQSSKGKLSKTKLLILDEPTTGLHLADVHVLVGVLNRLVNEGYSLLVIEHHLDVIKCADWILDMGPEAGEAGGQIIATGTPEQIAKNSHSVTGKFLAPKLSSATYKPKLLAPSKGKDVSSSEVICIKGARHHNLKNISIDIPRNQMVVVTGLSGSGKSTLAFDLLFGEGQRRYLDCLNTYARQFIEKMERPQVDSITGIPPSVAIEQRTSRGGGKSTVATITEIYQFLRLLYAKLGVQHDPDTQEEARQQTYEEILSNTKLLLKKEGSLELLAPLVRGRKGFHTEVAKWAEKHNYEYLRVNGKMVEVIRFKALDRYKEHHIDLYLGELSLKNKDWEFLLRDALHRGKGTIYLLNSQGKQSILSTELFCPKSGRSFEPLDPRMFSFNSPHGWCPECQGFGSIVQVHTEAETEVERELEIERIRENLEDGEEIPCPSCKGSRLNPLARAVRFAGHPIPEINRMPIREFESFFAKLKLDHRSQMIARDILPEISQRIKFLKRVGLDYLNLDRSATTLSGGESQRIRLAAQLGSNLQGVLYVLDEPTIGLHPRDNEDLLIALKELQGRGNSLLIVEHDEDTMKKADLLIDLGPGAGINGGEIVAQGSWKEVAKSKHSPTAIFLGDPLVHPMQGSRREVTSTTPSIRIIGARANNLKGVDCHIPHGRLTVITGVSGSGKSTLMHEVLVPAILSSKDKKALHAKTWSKISGHEDIEKIVEVNQSPIGKTSRSTLATYVGIMDTLRDLFAKIPEAKSSGFTRSHFSHNNGAGRCPECKGQGTVCVEMNFLPPTYVPCDVCNGMRWTPRVLDIRYRDKNIFDVLQLSVDKALEFFAGVPDMALPLRLLQETGLGYLTLGQTSPTLSGGEAQRIKLVTELAQAASIEQKKLLKTRATKNSHFLYILEEPSVGLHLSDVKRLIEMIHQLVDKGHTVVVVEHHLDLIAEADHIIDIGPESGDEGGEILFEGTPEKLLKRKDSHTARFLAPILSRKKSLSIKNSKNTKNQIAGIPMA